MFGFGKKSNEAKGSVTRLETPDMSKVAPGSLEETKIYETWKDGKAVVQAAQREAEVAALETVGGDVGIVKPDESLLIHSGEVPVVAVEQPQLPPVSEGPREQ